METGKDKVIVFGSGQIGHDALMFLGAENVFAFCDNNLSLAGTEKWGKPVISFAELKAEYGNAVILIAAAGRKAYDIAEQCEENGVSDYLIYTFLRDDLLKLDGMQMLSFLRDPLNRMRIRKDIYYKRAEELKEQVEYFKSHADIRHMKPARGELRYRQQQSVRVSTTFFKEIEKLEIKPILYGGNLIGYVRHGGFTPWDDDIDFALIREEYERLKEYCKRHIYTESEWNEKKPGAGKEIEAGMERYFWTQWHDHFCIVEVREDGYRTGVDFFPLEYYADHYSLSELRALSDNLRTELIGMESEEEKIRYMEEARAKNRENTAKESDHIYFGIDSTEMRHTFHRDHFIPKNVIFPLKKILWEGEHFLVPNDPEEFLTYEFEDCWNFPDDVGIPMHFNMRGEDV